MDLRLLHCPKCKRKTLQVKMSILTPEHKYFAFEEIDYHIRHEQEYSIDDIEKSYSIEATYCPCCGKTWTENTPPIPKPTIISVDGTYQELTDCSRETGGN